MGALILGRCTWVETTPKKPRDPMAPRSSTPRPPMPRLWCRRKSGRSQRSSETSSSGRGWCETWFRGGLYYWYLLITTNNRKILINNQYIPVSWDGRKVFFMFFFVPWKKTIFLDEFDHDLTSWRHWNDGEWIRGNHPHSWPYDNSYFQVHELS